MAVNPLGMNQGTQNFLRFENDGGTINTQVVDVRSIGTVNGGTINRIENGSIVVVGFAQSQLGTLNHGTIDAGTLKLDGRPARNILSYGTTFAGTAAAYGTLIGSASVGAGTSTWICDLSIINSKGVGTTTALVGFGTALNGTSVLVKGDFSPQGGIQKSYPLPVNAGMTNQDLVFYLGAAGTMDVNVSYFISA